MAYSLAQHTHTLPHYPTSNTPTLRAKGRTNVDLGKVSLKKAGDGKVVSPLKFLSKFNKSAPTPRGAASTPR